MLRASDGAPTVCARTCGTRLSRPEQYNIVYSQHRFYRWKDMKMRIIIAIGIAILLVIIIVPIVKAVHK